MEQRGSKLTKRNGGTGPLLAIRCDDLKNIKLRPVSICKSTPACSSSTATRNVSKSDDCRSEDNINVSVKNKAVQDTVAKASPRKWPSNAAAYREKPPLSPRRSNSVKNTIYHDRYSQQARQRNFNHKSTVQQEGKEANPPVRCTEKPVVAVPKPKPPIKPRLNTASSSPKPPRREKAQNSDLNSLERPQNHKPQKSAISKTARTSIQDSLSRAISINFQKQENENLDDESDSYEDMSSLNYLEPVNPARLQLNSCDSDSYIQVEASSVQRSYDGDPEQRTMQIKHRAALPTPVPPAPSPAASPLSLIDVSSMNVYEHSYRKLPSIICVHGDVYNKHAVGVTRQTARIEPTKEKLPNRLPHVTLYVGQDPLDTFVHSEAIDYDSADDYYEEIDAI